jgi:SHS2 domain-containing protein
MDTTADVGLTSCGLSLTEVYANMAKGLFSLITPLSRIRKKLCHRVDARASSYEDLLVAWLNELIFIRETEGLLFRYFEITSLVEDHLKSACFGEVIDPKRHLLRMEIKAATYHRTSVLQDSNGLWHARVIFDV